MTDYIKRKTALEDFERCNAENPNWTPQRVKTLLLRQPAADVAEVVYGQWQGEGDGYADGALVYFLLRVRSGYVGGDGGSNNVF